MPNFATCSSLSSENLELESCGFLLQKPWTEESFDIVKNNTSGEQETTKYPNISIF